MHRVASLLAISVVATLASAAVGADGVEAQVPGEAVTVVDPIDIPPEHDPLAHAFDQPGQRGGFYLRPSIGIGVQNTRFGPAGWESDNDGAAANGFATGYGLDIGGFVRPWVALHLDTNLGILWNAELESDLRVVGQREGDVRVLAYGFAPAATFFAPHGFYFKPAFGVGLARVKSRGGDYTTDPGFYMDLVAGKDLFVDRHFSVGLQFQIIYMRLGADLEDDEARVRQFLFGVSFGFDSR
jgi:hypothetical protein